MQQRRKTHPLGPSEEVQRAGGYFFLVSLLDATAFWRSVLLSVADGLTRPGEDDATQLDQLLGRLADVVDAPALTRNGYSLQDRPLRGHPGGYIRLVRMDRPGRVCWRAR